MDRGDCGPVQHGERSPVPAPAHQRHAHGCAVQRPRVVRPGVGDRAGLRQRVQHPAVRAAADAVGGHQPGPRRPAGGHGLLRPREPVAHQVRLRRHLPGVSGEQRVAVGVPQDGAQALAAQERRVADDGVRGGPCRRAAIGQHGVPALDGVQRPQHRVGRRGVAVAARPLDVPDPYGHPGQLRRIRVHLQPQHHVRPHPRRFTRQAQRLRLDDGAVLHVLDGLQRQVQEVAGAAGGVQHAEGAQPGQEGLEQRLRPCVRLVLSAGAIPGPRPGVQDPGDALPRLRPIGQQRLADHRADHPFDHLGRGVVGAQLAALAGVQPALEQGAEDGGVHVGPVQLGGKLHLRHVGRRERQGRVVVEQPAVEPGDGREAHHAAAPGHGGEELPGHALERRLLAAGGVQHPGQHPRRQQAHVVRKQAEDQAVDEVRDRLRRMAAVPQQARQHGEAPGGVRRHRGAGLAGPQLIGVGERLPEDVQAARGGKVVQAKLDPFGDGVGPVGADDDARDVAGHEQRRVLQRAGVLQELPVRGLQVLVLAFVLPGEAAPAPHVGPAAAAAGLGGTLLEGVGLAGGIAVGGGFAEQGAQV